MSELKTQAELDNLKKAELVALVLQIQDSYKTKLEEIASADVVELSNKLEASEAANKELSADVIRLNELLAKSEKNSKADADVIQIGNASYTMSVKRFRYKGQVVTAEVLKSNPELAEALVKEGCSFLNLVND